MYELLLDRALNQVKLLNSFKASELPELVEFTIQKINETEKQAMEFKSLWDAENDHGMFQTFLARSLEKLY